MRADVFRLIYHRVSDFISLRQENKNKPLITFALIHAAILMGIFVVLSQFFYGAPGVIERDVALKILDGQVPYVDFSSEYLPLALLSFLIPAVVVQAPLAYSIAYAAEILMLDLIVLLLLRTLSARLNMPLAQVFRVYTIFLLAIGPLIVIRHDLLPALLVLAALWAFVSGKRKTAWVMLGLGVMAKLFPVILAPIFAMHYLRHKQHRELARGIAVFLIVILVLSLPWMALNANGFLDILKYHAERGLESETTYASGLMVGQLLGLTTVEGEFSFGSWNISSPLADSLSRLSLYILAGFLLIIYILYARAIWRKQDTSSRTGAFDGETVALVVRFSLLVLTVFLLTSKVLSAQYLIWLCPLLPLVNGRWNTVIWSLFIAAAVITQYIFPYGFNSFELGEPYIVALMATRNFLLTIMAVFLLLPGHPRVKQRQEYFAMEKSPAP